MPFGLTDRWDGSDDFAKFQLVQDGCFTSGIKSNLRLGCSVSIKWSTKVRSIPSIYL